MEVDFQWKQGENTVVGTRLGKNWTRKNKGIKRRDEEGKVERNEIREGGRKIDVGTWHAVVVLSQNGGSNRGGFNIVIADESHFLKNAQAKRTNASVPILQLQALYPEVYKNVHEYGNRYCRGGFFGIYQGASNHEELHNLMKATVMIRRLKKDVLSELPVKRRQQVFLELHEKDLKQIRALFHELEVIKSNIQACDSVEMVESLRISRRNIINKIYNDSAEAKIPAVLDYLGTVVEKKKVDCIRIDGSTPSSTRQELISQFQENDGIKAAVLSIKAAGVGLTLTAASTVIFAELSWTPGDIIQAEDRAHRIGQAHSVNIYYLLANETVDDIIWDVVQGKLENLGQVLDGHENTLDISTCEQKGSPAKRSPAKQTTLDSFLKRSSPAKQRTMDSFLKRCPGATEGTSQHKIPRK
ncbi:hypothetical protein Taro_019232 [Colocasia esculenta]|uniref:Helicase C-terminal domain-containing protein n=1 Tax=Colocasia esculenta TaxID=4460 RepID=A0A843V1K5_COLES|nr:hypothetical protein [Colocasia esculenta]